MLWIFQVYLAKECALGVAISAQKVCPRGKKEGVGIDLPTVHAPTAIKQVMADNPPCICI